MREPASRLAWRSAASGGGAAGRGEVPGGCGGAAPELLALPSPPAAI